MKRFLLILTVLLVLALSGCGQEQNAASGEGAPYHSDIAKENCYYAEAASRIRLPLFGDRTTSRSSV